MYIIVYTNLMERQNKNKLGYHKLSQKQEEKPCAPEGKISTDLHTNSCRRVL
jgi:hypothetical protein